MPATTKKIFIKLKAIYSWGPMPEPIVQKPPSRHRTTMMIAIIIVVAIIALASAWYYYGTKHPVTVTGTVLIEPCGISPVL
jgi:hypothetical protein